MTGSVPQGPRDYRKRWSLSVGPERVFDALQPAGIRGWWTPLVEGAGRVDDDLVLRFAGLSEHIRLRVLVAQRPHLVQWLCLEHTSLPEWDDTQMWFEVTPRDGQQSEVVFTHKGLTASLACFDDCALGWDHFLASLTRWAQSGFGQPFGT